MIVTSSVPLTTEQIAQVKERFGIYVKTVIDIRGKICCAGMDRHFEGENILLQSGSHQADIWGGGIDLVTQEIDYNSFINIRPQDNNTKNEIQSEQVKKIYTELTIFFFRLVL
ncbi:hypothetical protein HY339_00090 [Candidatus Gottesmanbacteria bacterium]|nr:hypothetical protein [Candidatus Gottesmanbacteria bacterium]